MIIVKLMGGVGNQLFQYAAGRRLAHFRGSELKLDLNWFGDIVSVDAKRNYELAPFNIQASIAMPGELASFRDAAQFRRLKQLAGSLPFVKKHHIYEKHYHFDPDILNLYDDVYLEGYWQCPRYFSDIEDIIRKEFTVRSALDGLNKQITEKIAGEESVSIHVRRGDYVSNPETGKFHGICSLEYYRSAVKLIAARVKRPHFFIFSDDPDWAKLNLTFISQATFIDSNGPDKAYEDMRLLSLCKHHIIANSSFSWWGAWLCANPEKIVIAPKQWFKDPKIDTRDLVPETWIRI